MSRIIGSVVDHSITFEQSAPDVYDGGLLGPIVLPVRTIDVRLKIAVQSIQSSGVDPIRQLMEEILIDVGESIGATQKRPGQALVDSLKKKVDELAAESRKHESEAIRLQGIIDAFYKANTALIFNSTQVRESNAAKNRRS